jgi:hypothetical protein
LLFYGDDFNEDSKNHSRHFDKESCRTFGLKIVDLEDNDLFQDAILSIHHAYMTTLASTSAMKIIENHLGKAFIIQQNTPPN